MLATSMIRRIALLIAFAIVLTSGCEAPQRDLSKKYTNVRPGTRPEVVKAYVYEYNAQFAASVQSTANRIMNETDDPEVRRNALRWKINAIPASQLAGFRVDSVGGVLDSWRLTVQMRQLFTDGAARDAFGAQQHLAIETAKSLEREIVEIAIKFSRDEERVRVLVTDAVEEWAGEHPLSLEFVRDPGLREFADEIDQPVSGLATLGSLEELASDMAHRTKIYAAFLPRQARWQTELVLMDIYDNETVERLSASAEQASDAARRAADVAEEIPDVIDASVAEVATALEGTTTGIVESVSTERVAIVNAIAREREVALDAITQERVQVIDAFREERGMVLASVDDQRVRTLEAISGEREIILAAVREERQAVLAALTSERQSLVRELRDAALETVTASEPELEAVVDHAFWRAIQFVIGVIIVFPFVAKVYIRILRPAA